MSRIIAELAGQVVVAIELVGTVRMHFGEFRDQQLTIESVCYVEDAAGHRTEIEFRPEKNIVRGLDVLGRLFGVALAAAEEADDGSFMFSFVGGETLFVPVDPDFEAGHLATPEGYLVIPPGGR